MYTPRDSKVGFGCAGIPDFEPAYIAPVFCYIRLLRHRLSPGSNSGRRLCQIPTFKSLRVYLLCMFFLATAVLSAQPPLFPQEEQGSLIVYNRILAKVHSKTISVIDVMKKMDFFLQKRYPEYFQSKAARYQFYSTHWQEYLSQMVDDELMLADAEHLELKVSEAEVREEILTRFGPNIVPTLETMGLTYDEVKKMVRNEMIVQRMIWLRVNSKALNRINSEDVKFAYRKFCEKNPPLEEWKYQVLSIRSRNVQASAALASHAFDLLQNHLQMEKVKDSLTPGEEETIHLADLEADEKTVSQMHKQVLLTLAENSYSAPVEQKSRVDQSIVHRIFYLKKHSKKETPSFEKMAEQLKDELLQQEADQENIHYLARLKERMSYDEKQMIALPENFQPFALR